MIYERKRERINASALDKCVIYSIIVGAYDHVSDFGGGGSAHDALVAKKRLPVRQNPPSQCLSVAVRCRRRRRHTPPPARPPIQDSGKKNEASTGLDLQLIMRMLS